MGIEALRLPCFSPPRLASRLGAQRSTCSCLAHERQRSVFRCDLGRKQHAVQTERRGPLARAAKPSEDPPENVAEGYSVLTYTYVNEIEKKRGPYRSQHLAYAREKAVGGKLLMAGATGSPLDGALFLWKATTQQEIEEFVSQDVYFTSGLVTAYEIKPFHVVIQSTSFQ